MVAPALREQDHWGNEIEPCAPERERAGDRGREQSRSRVNDGSKTVRTAFRDDPSSNEEQAMSRPSCHPLADAAEYAIRHLHSKAGSQRGEYCGDGQDAGPVRTRERPDAIGFKRGAQEQHGWGPSNGALRSSMAGRGQDALSEAAWLAGVKTHSQKQHGWPRSRRTLRSSMGWAGQMELSGATSAARSLSSKQRSLGGGDISSMSTKSCTNWASSVR